MTDNNLLEELRTKKPRKIERKVVKKVVDTPLVSGLIIATILAIVGGVGYCAERYVDWRAEHQWQYPVVWIGPVKVIEKKIEHVKTIAEIAKPYKLSPVLQSIYMLESTSGKNDACKEQGKFNGYGYRQNSRESKCFNSFEEVTGYVNEWFEDRLSTNGNNLIEAVCYYNTGLEHQNTCGDYSDNFWSVLTNYF